MPQKLLSLRAPLFWLTLLFAYVAAILPKDRAVTLGADDKTDHIAAFILLTLLCRLAYVRSSRWLALMGLSAFGVLIELTQGLPVVGRDADIVDWIADSLAIVAALGLSAVLEQKASSIYK